MFTSGIPPALLEITGVSAAIASNAAKPKLSCSEGNKNTSANFRIWYKLSTFPSSLILLMRCGFSLINSLMTSTSGPSPKINNLDFTDFSTLLKISKTSLILFTGRRLET